MSSLYQKYRSQMFSEILTQHHVTHTLQSSLKNNSFGHAYLFVGTRGTGKTSIARIFARAINCENESFVKESGEPCNICQSCILSMEGANIDIIEMDAASNRGIEEVRNLKEGVDFLPSSGKYKVYIIDEVHMMTKEAFNALLKTIEEPPKHAVFIMCTTEIFKVPATIISRSQVFEMKQAKIDEIVAKIDKIIEQENVKISNESKKIIAKLGKGSFRDTESILEKVIINGKDKSIEVEHLMEILGMSAIFIVNNVKELIYSKNISGLIKAIEQEVDEGMLSSFTYQLAETIYEDISNDLESNIVNPEKYMLFEYLVSLEKDLKGTLNPKILFIARLINFITKSDFTNNLQSIKIERNTNTSLSDEAKQVAVEDKKIVQPVQINESYIEGEIKVEDIDISKLNSNPSALLRHRKQISPTTNQGSSNSDEETVDTAKNKFISKLDFLNYLQEKNNFLFRFFSHHEFQIYDGKVIVDVQRQMEKDLMTKPQTVNLLRSFGEQHGMTLKIEFGDVKLDKRKREEKEITKTQKKVEDLSEDEIKDVFLGKKA